MSRRLSGMVLIAFGVLVAGCSNNNTSGPVGPEVTPPTAASGLYAASTAPEQIQLRWQDNSDNETGFRIERKDGDEGQFVALPDTVAANHIGYTDVSIVEGVWYTYQVIAYIHELNAAPSNQVRVLSVTNTSPATPSSPQPPDGTVDLDPTSAVVLAWQSSDGDGDPITYDVLFGPTPFSMTEIAQGVTETSLPAPGPFDRNSTYFWRVIAHDPKGVSSPSHLWGFNTLVDRVNVPAGPFVMGDSLQFFHPGNPVQTDAFSIDKYEVTNQQYADFLNQELQLKQLRLGGPTIQDAAGANPYAQIYPDDVDSDIYFSVADSAFLVTAGREKFPVVEVSWYGADAYARFYHRRLPTEAEWEKAARGTSRDDGYRVFGTDTVGIGFAFPWGSEYDLSRANVQNSGDPYESQGGVRTTPVGFYDTGGQQSVVRGGYTVHSGASPYGAEDMSGNVWEWCDDWFGAYRNPHEPPSTGKFKVLRGGGYNRPWGSATTYNRSPMSPDMTDHAFGFRTVGTPVQ